MPHEHFDCDVYMVAQRTGRRIIRSMRVIGYEQVDRPDVDDGESTDFN